MAKQSALIEFTITLAVFTCMDLVMHVPTEAEQTGCAV